MPETTAATFTEVLEVGADAQYFATSLVRLTEEYETWVRGLGAKAPEVVGAGVFSGLMKEMQKLSAEFNKQNELATQSATALVEKVDSLQEAAAAKQSKRVKALSEEELALARALAAAKAELASNLSTPRVGENTYRDIQSGVQGAADQYTERVFAEISANREVSRKIEIEQQGLIDNFTKQQETNQQRYNTILEKTVVLEKEITTARMQGSGVVDPGQTAGLQRLNVLIAEAKTLGAQINQQGTQLGASPKSIASLQQYNDILRKIISEQQQLNALEVTAVQAQKEMNTAQKEMNTTLDPKKPKDFWGAWTFGLKGSLVHLTRFYVLMQAISLTVDLLKHTIGAPFVALQEGVKYLRDVEKTADELMGVMMSNVRYSEDLVKNYQLARAAAEGTVKAVQAAAIANHVNAESLLGTVKALMEGGATRYVSNMEDLVNLAVMFTQSLKAANVGGLAAQGAIKEIGKLFDGTSQSANKFLLALKMSPIEFSKILEQAKQTGNLVELLGPKMAPFLDAVETGKQHQQVLMDNLALMWKQIQAEGNETAFAALSTTIQSLTEWLSTHRGQLVAFFKLSADMIVKFIEALIKLEKYSGQLTILELAARSLLAVLTGIASAAMLAGAGMKYLSNMANAYSHHDLIGMASATIELKKNLAEIKQFATDAGEVVLGTAEKYNQAAYVLAQQTAWGNTRPGFTGPVKPFVGPVQAGAQRGFDYDIKKPFTNLNQSLPKEYDIRDITNGARNDLKAYKDAAVEIEQVAKDRMNAVKTALSDEAMSHEEAASKVEDITSVEIGKLSARWNQYESERAKRRKDLFDTKASSLEEQERKQTDLDNFDATTESERTSYKGQINQINQVRIDAEIAANKEQQQIRKAHTRALLTIDAERAKEELAIAAQRHEAGYLTDLQFMDAETKTAEKEHKNRVAILNQDLADLRAGGPGAKDTKTYKDILDKLILEDVQYSAATKLQAKQREEATAVEIANRRAYYLELRGLNVEAMSIALDISNALTPNDTYTQSVEDMYSLRARQLEQLREEKQLLLDIAKAKNPNSTETRSLTLDVQQAENDRLSLYGTQVGQINSTTSNPSLRALYQRALANATLGEFQKNADDAANAVDSENARISAKGPGYRPTSEEVKELTALNEAWQNAAARVSNFGITVDKLRPTFANALTQFTAALTGVDIKTAWDKAKTTAEKAAVVGDIVSGALAGLGNALGAWNQGKASGGTLGGIGGLMNNFMPALSSIPVVGQFIPAVAGALSFVGQMFTAAAQRIAESVKKDFDKTLQKYQDGNASLQQTIQDLEAQRNYAIRRLSGTKGGKDQLDELLPDFDNQIKQLKKTQTDVIKNFDDALEGLMLQSDTLSSIHKQWVDINKQVQDYLGAGGDATKAAQFLSLSLQGIQEVAQSELSQGEQAAIQDAIKLNDLLTQRKQLMDDFNKQEFALINQDAIERRQAGSVTRGKELADLRAQHDLDMKNIDEEIQMTTLRVDKEREVFTLGTSIEELHRRDEELTLLALDTQIQKWNDLKSIIASITMDPDGIFKAIGGVFTAPVSTTNVAFNFYGPVSNPEDVMDPVTDYFDKRSRMIPSYA